jgi:hypothetical protein
VIGLGAGELAGGFVLLLGSSGSDADFARLADSLVEQQRSGKAASDVLRAIEAEWGQRARQASNIRFVGGILGVSAGAVGIGCGTYFAQAGASPSDKNQRNNLAAACFTLGGIGLVFGMREFFFESASEVAWKTRQAGRARASEKRLEIHVAPSFLPGGGALGVHGWY